jgi:hypothetical protein
MNSPDAHRSLGWCAQNRSLLVVRALVSDADTKLLGVEERRGAGMASRLHDDSPGGERGKHANLGDAGLERWRFRDNAVERDRGTPLAHNSTRNEVHDARWQGPEGSNHIEVECIEPNGMVKWQSRQTLKDATVHHDRSSEPRPSIDFAPVEVNEGVEDSVDVLDAADPLPSKTEGIH